MELQDKIRVLAESAKYDVSCSSSGADRKAKDGMLGSTALAGICHSWTEDGRCISLLKILFSNDCIYDCAYCVNRKSNDFQRATFTPEELAKVTMGFYRRNYIEGIFLSSAVVRSPDHTMEQMIEMIKILRHTYRYNGYIHLKVIPGADLRLVEMAGHLVDRISVNLELPTKSSLKLLAPQKKHGQILSPMRFIQNRLVDQQAMTICQREKSNFVPAGQTTQIMIGATDDSDYAIMRISENMYDKMAMKRVYYSAYIPVVQNHSVLPDTVKAPLLREHRLYQADWLLRFYGFNAGELLNEERPNFDLRFDPKSDWALRHLHLFPVEVNKADLDFLLRIPGIGPTSARRIVKARRYAWLDYDDLKKMGVVLKRAKYFILCKGKSFTSLHGNEAVLRNHLALADPRLKGLNDQLSLFEFYPEALGDSRIYLPGR